MDVALLENKKGSFPSWDEEQKILASFFMNIRSSLTEKAYRAATLEFFQLVSSDVRHPTDLQRHHLVFYRRYLEEKGLAPKTIQKKLAAFSSLCRYLAEAGLVGKDIAYGVARPPSENKRETADVSDSDVKRIFAGLNQGSYTFASHRAILSIGFYVGLRSTEIRNLRIKNIGVSGGLQILNLKVKGDKIHEILLHPFVLTALDVHLNVLKERGFKIDDKNHVLFPSLKTGENRPMSAEALNYIFQSALRRAGISRNTFQRYSPHSMRATFAGHLLNSLEARLVDVQRAMGHVNPATTQRYNKRLKSHDKSPIYKIEY
ncbi:MAG: hypothetical protein EOP04_02725 [Proteobacteria bacterium]|nr:MAG: hypothetical protein EOP04_02725 [Pseudomonadota bacterium]